MDQKNHHKRQKKKWEKPILVDLDVAAYTKSGFGGAQTDWSNTSATNTDAS